ncbi:hypothetical protein WMY93_023048 [Mugilogobius chulae]|uniref:Uncharacterized protein n=1 Tax=Mugilogobius chulae TaxID=88201 RepID=A0AAW0ND72_9GOBI
METGSGLTICVSLPTDPVPLRLGPQEGLARITATGQASREPDNLTMSLVPYTTLHYTALVSKRISSERIHVDSSHTHHKRHTVGTPNGFQLHVTLGIMKLTFD